MGSSRLPLMATRRIPCHGPPWPTAPFAGGQPLTQRAGFTPACVCPAIPPHTVAGRVVGVMLTCMTTITLQRLRKVFGSTVAVDDADIEIAAGDLFFLLGPSGCGKTTLLRMLAGFTEPTAGRIFLGEHDVTDLPANRRNTGMVFQGYALWPHMTVAQNVGFGLQVRRVGGAEREKQVNAALRMVQMGQYADRRPNELSGGQQQRVALARALVVKPTVLLLDEPLSNLDAKLRLEMRGQIKHLCKQSGITAVYVTHDQKEALSMADTVAVLDHGKVMQVGTPRELYVQPRNRFVADFLGETNFIQGRIKGRDNGRVLIDCPAGRLVSSTFADDLPSDGDVTCSIRPEAIRLLGEGEPAPENVLTARRREVIYLGEMAQHLLRIGGDVPVKAFELNPRLLPEAGETRIAFEPRDVVILSD